MKISKLSRGFMYIYLIKLAGLGCYRVSFGSNNTNHNLSEWIIGAKPDPLTTQTRIQNLLKVKSHKTPGNLEYFHFRP